MLQGLHHGAQKSTTTGFFEFATSLSSSDKFIATGFEEFKFMVDMSANCTISKLVSAMDLSTFEVEELPLRADIQVDTPSFGKIHIWRAI